MSKRKYAKDVTEMRYTSLFLVDGSFCGWLVSTRDEVKCEPIIPVRVVRESFYRKLIKRYEQVPKTDYWGHRIKY